MILFIKASDPKAEVHLHCGPRDKIGIPTSLNSISSSLISTPFDHGWSQLAFNNPPNPIITTTPINNHRMRSHLSVTTPSSFINMNSSKYTIHSNLQ
jgi:hypothetical protein